MVAMICMGSGHLVLHSVVLGSHRNGLCVHAVPYVLHPPLWRRHGLMVVLPDLSRLAVAAGLYDHMPYIFRVSLRGVVADVDDVVFPVQPDFGDVWLLSQGPLDGTGAAQAVHAAEFERGMSRVDMVMIGCCHSVEIHVGHGSHLLLSTLRTLSLPRAKGSIRPGWHRQELSRVASASSGRAGATGGAAPGPSG